VTREGPPAAGTRQGQPRSLCRTARGGTGPLSGGREVRAPEAGRSGLACDGPAITRGSPGPPWGDRVRGGYPRALQPSWGHGGPGPRIAQGGSGDHGSSCQARAVCLVSQKARGRLRIVRCQGPGHPSRRYHCLYVPTKSIKTKQEIKRCSLTRT
jgi:hypothetical protein